jgi:hypothetical protein
VSKTFQICFNFKKIKGDNSKSLRGENSRREMHNYHTHAQNFLHFKSIKGYNSKSFRGR